jgi:hypothetical protein
MEENPFLQVKTWKMHMFTAFQFLGLVVLWMVLSIKAIALFFPFFVLAMIPLRILLNFVFTPKELDAVSDLKLLLLYYQQQLPVLVRSQKLRNIGPGQYTDEWPCRRNARALGRGCQVLL